MNLYKLSFTAAGQLSQMPDSQKIFGALCSIISATRGKEKLEEYFQSFEHEPLLIHSSMMIDGTMPMIKENLFDIVEVNKTIRDQSSEKQLAVLSEFKTYKRISAVSERVFNTYLLSGETDKLKQDLLDQEILSAEDGLLCFNDEDLSLSSAALSFYRARLDVVTEDSDEGRLFRDTAVFYPADTRFKIYVKTSMSQQEITELFSYLQYFAAGNKGSIGRNQFRLIDVEPVSLKGTSLKKMVLSRYIPKEDEFSPDGSSYELLTSNHIANPAHRGDISTRKISCFSEGSFMKFNEEKEYYGQVICYQAGEQKQYHYGIGFVV